MYRSLVCRHWFAVDSTGVWRAGAVFADFAAADSFSLNFAALDSPRPSSSKPSFADFRSLHLCHLNAKMNTKNTSYMLFFNLKPFFLFRGLPVIITASKNPG